MNSQVAGQVVNLGKKIGDEVAASTPPVLLIADFTNPAVTSEISEVNIPRIRVGQEAKMVFDAFPDSPFTGTVEMIDTVGTNKQGTIVYSVRIGAARAPEGVRPAMTAAVTIETMRKDNVLTVPNTAITVKNGKNYVTKNGRLVEIEFGVRGLTKTEVVSGINEGDTISVPK